MHWLSQAPANIALIKYMGKDDEALNLPANPSLSYTLPHLITTVKLEVLGATKDLWEPLNIPGAADFILPKPAQDRFIAHLQRIKEKFAYDGGFLIQSSNNFPHSAGLASSASSFAALTKCAVHALTDLTQKPALSIDEQAQLSRLGSGSSCRSFYSPWALWKHDEVLGLDLPEKNLIHQVVVINRNEKKISSSDAHKQVKTSIHFATRKERAQENLKVLLNALNVRDWKAVYQICWREFQDMHLLFHTCTEPFTYMTEDCLNLLQIIQKFWEKNDDGPVVTMDAGPNIHLLYRSNQANFAEQFKRVYLVNNYDVL